MVKSVWYVRKEYCFQEGLVSANFKKEAILKPARIPPQTPPAGGKSAEAGRIHFPRQIVSPCRVRFNHFRFRFLDLCIRFGKIISKVCEGFNSGAKKLDTNSNFEVERVRSPSPANGGAGLRFARATPSLWREMKRILMLSGEFNFFFLRINNTNL